MHSRDNSCYRASTLLPYIEDNKYIFINKEEGKLYTIDTNSQIEPYPKLNDKQYPNFDEEKFQFISWNCDKSKLLAVTCNSSIYVIRILDDNQQKIEKLIQGTNNKVVDVRWSPYDSGSFAILYQNKLTFSYNNTFIKTDGIMAFSYGDPTDLWLKYCIVYSKKGEKGKLFLRIPEVPSDYKLKRGDRTRMAASLSGSSELLFSQKYNSQASSEFKDSMEITIPLKSSTLSSDIIALTWVNRSLVAFDSNQIYLIQINEIEDYYNGITDPTKFSFVSQETEFTEAKVIPLHDYPSKGKSNHISFSNGIFLTIKGQVRNHLYRLFVKSRPLCRSAPSALRKETAISTEVGNSTFSVVDIENPDKLSKLQKLADMKDICGVYGDHMIYFVDGSYKLIQIGNYPESIPRMDYLDPSSFEEFVERNEFRVHIRSRQQLVDLEKQRLQIEQQSLMKSIDSIQSREHEIDDLKRSLEMAVTRGEEQQRRMNSILQKIREKKAKEREEKT